MSRADRDADVKRGETRVAIIGNSNSVMYYSYARVLAGYEGVIVNNRSIGATPNVVLLDFLAVDQDLDYDFIIVETAVVDFLMSDVLYSQQRSRETLEIFLRYMRHNSAATIIFLLIPTRQGLLEPERYWQEQLYLDVAAKYNIPVLDGFSLVRQLVGPRKMNIAELSVATTETLLSSFRLPRYIRDSMAWRTLRDEQIIPNALGVFGFNDHAHFAPAMHSLVSSLLRAYMDRKEDQQPVSTVTGKPPGSPDVVLAADPQGAEWVSRGTSLISRKFAKIAAGEVVRYACPDGFKAHGLLLNRATTSCVLRLGSRIGGTAFDLRFIPRGGNLTAVIIPILDQVGGGDIDVTIDAAPRPDEKLWQWSDICDVCPTPSAEIAEIILVRDDWASALSTPVQAAERLPFINEHPWAKDLIAEAASAMNNTVVGIEADGRFMDKAMFRFVAETISGNAETLSPADRARLLLVMGARRELTAYLEAVPDSGDPDDSLAEMRDALIAVDRELNISPKDLLDKIRQHMATSDFDEAEVLLNAGCRRFPTDIGFFAERAWIPFRRRDWAAAIERWSEVKALFPESAIGWLGVAATLRASGRVSEAEALLAQTVDTFPDEANAAAQHAAIALERDDPQEAMRRMKATRDRFPSHRQNRMALIKLAISMGDLSEAKDEVNSLVQTGGITDELVILAAEVSVKDLDPDWLEQLWDRLHGKISRYDMTSSQIRKLFDHSPSVAMPSIISLWLQKGGQA